MATLSEETIALVRMAQADTKRGINTLTGLTGYLLEEPAKAIVPIITPLRNMIPRRNGKGAPNVNWKAITSFDTNRTLGVVNEGALPSSVNYNVANMQNVFATIALSNSVSFQAQWRGRMLEGDVRARRAAELLYQLMTVEERWIITASQKLFTPPAPLVTATTTGGSVPAGTYWVQVTAFNSSGETLPSAQAVNSGSTYGVITTTGATSVISIQIFTVPNAVGYNIYIGSGATPPANTAMFRQNSISGANAPQPGFNAPVSLLSGGTATSAESAGPVINLSLAATPAASGANPPTVSGAYTSTDTVTGQVNIWDGLMAQALNNSGGSGALGSVVARPSDPTGAFMLADIDALLLQMYAQSASDPDILIVNPIDSARITNLQASSGQTRYVIDANSPEQKTITANYRVTHYLNKTTGKAIPIVEDRYNPVGCLLLMSMRMPFPVAEINNAVEIETNQEYWGIDFAITNSSYQFADYVESTLKVYFLGGLGMLWGCAPSA